MAAYSDIKPGLSFNEFLAQTLGRDVVISDDELAQCYEEYAKVEVFDLSSDKWQSDPNCILTEKTAVLVKAIIISRNNEGFVVGFANPFDEKSVSRVASVLNDYVKPVMVNAKLLQRLHRIMYRKLGEVQAYALNIKPEKVTALNAELIESSAKYTIPGLVHLIIQDAYDLGASDIHFENDRSQLKIRVRVDGNLNEYNITNVEISENTIRYLKLLSDIDVTQDRLPADGKKVTLVLNDVDINLRFSFMPTYYGQSVVVRILGDASTYILSDKIQNNEYLAEIQSYLKRSYGMFMISGPTGSGKTTTLYSALAEMDSAAKKIITLEDPVEARLPGLNQVQINEAAGYTFGQALRASLRQDPDVVMIGEIRDEDTAVMAVRAAITGHLVMASIHTRGVAEIPVRLLNLGLDAYLLASALRLNVSQRLVQNSCTHCKTPMTLEPHHRQFIEQYFGRDSLADDAVFYYGAGCELCQMTGCYGRSAVFELLHLDEPMINALSKGDIAEYQSLAKQALSGKTILDRAFALALSGQIAIDEVLKLEAD